MSEVWVKKEAKQLETNATNLLKKTTNKRFWSKGAFLEHSDECK